MEQLEQINNKKQITLGSFVYNFELCGRGYLNIEAAHLDDYYEWSTIIFDLELSKKIFYVAQNLDNDIKNTGLIIHPEKYDSYNEPILIEIIYDTEHSKNNNIKIKLINKDNNQKIFNLAKPKINLNSTSVQVAFGIVAGISGMLLAGPIGALVVPGLYGASVISSRLSTHDTVTTTSATVPEKEKINDAFTVIN